ncbi:MAG: DUF2484 family protein [Pseudomonadota bacterium]
MSLSATLAIAWVILATLVAFLPLRFQYAPGLLLLVAAPVLILWLGHDFGLLAGAGALAAFLSMFRNPLQHLWRKATGRFVQ